MVNVAPKRSPLGAVTTRSQAGRAPLETRLNLGARRLTHVETASGALFEATFDTAGRVLHQVDGNGVARELQWNPDGTLDRVEVAGGIEPTATIIYGYDLGNRLQSINVEPAPGLQGTERWPLSVGFGYDDLDNLTHAWDDRGIDVARTAWSSGELATETLTVDGQSFATSAAYDGTFLPQGITYPDSTSVILGRDDPAGRLSSLTVNGTQMWSQQYAGLRRGSGGAGALATSRAYDGEGRPQAVNAALGESERFRLECGYNDASRFNSQTLRAGVSSVSILTHDRAERTQNWRMDRSGTAGVDQVLAWAGPASGRVDNTFGGANGDRLATKAQYIDGEALLTVFGEPGSTYKLPSAGPWSYGYDLFGNRDEAASIAEVRGFRHDWSNRLLEVLSTPNVDDPQNSVAAFRYDPLGRRVAQVEGDITTIRVPWGDQVFS